MPKFLLVGRVWLFLDVNGLKGKCTSSWPNYQPLGGDACILNSVKVDARETPERLKNVKGLRAGVAGVQQM